MKRASPAFTLLEVVVALAITALCIALVAMAFGAVSKAHARAQENLELQQTLNETIERIRVLLQSAYLSPYPMNQAQLITRFETKDLDNSASPYDALTFSTLANTSYKLNAKAADMAEVTFFTEKEPAPLKTPEGELQLSRLRVRVGGSINDRFEVEGGQVYTLAEHLTKFTLEYLTPEGEWKPEWIPLDNAGNLPCAVRVNLGLRTESLAERTASLIVPLEMSHSRCRYDDEKVFDETSIK